MSYFLIVDVSEIKAKVILGEGERVLYEDSWESQGNLSGTLLFKIDNILKKQRIEIKDINCIGAVLGPGSYTSLRISLSVVNGLSFSLNIPLIGLNKEGSDKKLLINFLKNLSEKKFSKYLLPKYQAPPKITKPKEKFNF